MGLTTSKKSKKSILYNINKYKGCKEFYGAKLKEIIVELKKLKDGRLNLKLAKLAGYDLSEIDLSNTDLQDADLSYANLTGTNLDGADITGVDFTGVIW